MSHLLFDGDTNSISLFNSKDQVIGTWPASNRGGPKSDFRVNPTESFVSFIPDGEYPFDAPSQRAPQRHQERGADTLNGTYGTLGILRLADIVFGGQLHRGLGIHAGHQTTRDSMLVSKTPRQQVHHQGAYYRTNGCIRTTEAAMHVIAATIAHDPLKFLRVRNNGVHPMIKVSGSEVRRL
jgi:hypothetical protein